MYLGLDLLSDASTFTSNKLESSLGKINLKNGIFDELFLTMDTSKFNSSNYEWNDNVLIWATFKEQSLVGGNVGSFGKLIESIQLNRREKGKKNWVTVAGYVVSDSEHLNFSFEDRYSRGRNTEYEYSVTYFLSDGSEIPYITADVVSKFYGAYIIDSEKSYHVFLDPEITTVTRNKSANVVTTLNSKYPYVFFGSDANYDTGSFSGTILKPIGCDDFDFDGSYSYRQEMIDWLTNEKPKILKIEDGREWLISVNGNVEADNSEHPDKVKLSFDFVEIGDYDNSDDLIAGGLSNLNETDYGVYYSIRSNLQNIKSSNNIVSIQQRETFSTTLSPATEYKLGSVTVTMNGIDITDSAYDVASGVISIRYVTGDVVIIAKGIKTTPDKIAFDYSYLTLTKNQSVALTLSFYPANVEVNNVTWLSTDPSIATVDNGIVTALKTGTAVIRATVGSTSASCSVNAIAFEDGIALDSFDEGEVVGILENNKEAPFIVAKHNYQEDLNGKGRTLLVRMEGYDVRRWNSSNINAYAGSEIDNWLTKTYINVLSKEVREAVSKTKIYYTVGNLDTSMKTLERSVFLLSATEITNPVWVGVSAGVLSATGTTINVEGSAISCVSALSTDKDSYWTRTPATQQGMSIQWWQWEFVKENYKVRVYTSDGVEFCSAADKAYSRPCFTLPHDFILKTIKPVKATSLSLKKTEASIKVGSAESLTVTITPTYITNNAVNFRSSNPFVATVNKDGKVSALTLGEATITASLDGHEQSCIVTVVE